MSDNDALVPSDRDALAEQDGDIQHPEDETPYMPPEGELAAHDTPRGEDEESILWEAAARQRKPSVYPTKGRLVVEGGSLVFIQPKRVLDISSYVITGLEIETPPLLNRPVIFGLVTALFGGLFYTISPLFSEGLAAVFPTLFPVMSALFMLAGAVAILYGSAMRKQRVVARTADTAYRFDLEDGDTPEKLIPILRNN
jgi:hypothetical protein